MNEKDVKKIKLVLNARLKGLKITNFLIHVRSVEKNS